jgi:Family of unknown function (DUF6527)
MTTDTFTPMFVEYIPRSLEPGLFYITGAYSTTAHLCACGCGNKVFLPLSPAEWRIQFDGDHVWVLPSIGNWEFPCRSHYWISANNVRWAAAWDEHRSEARRRGDERDLDDYFRTRAHPRPARSLRELVQSLFSR